MSTAVYESRRTKADIGLIKAAIVEVLEEERPATVRQVFYRLVSMGVIGKTENEYKSTVVRLLTQMRREGEIPFEWITDFTRSMRKPYTYDGVSDALAATAAIYRRNLWTDARAYVEVWLEKEALAGVLYDVTEKWDVPLMVTRGYPSLSFLFGAAATLSYVKKPAFLYYFGDYDPSGMDISRHTEERLRELAPSAEIHFERVAVNHDQIAAWDLPTRPTKKSDTRGKSWKGGSVEVDAIAPNDLRRMADDVIQQHVDGEQLKVLEIAEEEERDLLTAWANMLAAEEGNIA